MLIFRPKRCKNPTRWGGTYLHSLYRGVPPGFKPGGWRVLLGLFGDDVPPGSPNPDSFSDLSMDRN